MRALRSSNGMNALLTAFTVTVRRSSTGLGEAADGVGVDARGGHVRWFLGRLFSVWAYSVRDSAMRRAFRAGRGVIRNT